MKVFLSYRRDDTGGRAGRLFDALVTKYGRRDVFQDVDTVRPGADYTEQLDAAIAASDVMLVIIGPRWLSAPSTDGGRRVDRPDDLVRREVGAALASEIPVVPVLVDGASLPRVEDLPEDLQPLVHRQAAELRDVTWHQDVDDLLRRLRGEPAPGGGRSRRLVVAGVIAAVVVAGAIALFAATRGDGDDTADDDSESRSDDAYPACDADDGSWTEVAVRPDAEGTVTYDELHEVRFVVDAARYRSLAPDDHEVVLVVDMFNISESLPDTGDDDVYYGLGAFESLLVAGLATDDVECLSVTGDPNVEPNERATATVGVRTPVDPAGASLAFEPASGEPITVTDG